MSPEWRVLLAELADDLTARGKLSTPRWQAAFRSVPRHVFVPEYLEQDDRGAWHRVVVGDALAKVYRDVALCTDIDGSGVSVSSSSMPGLMTRMLDLLDVRDGDRVLEIGTGTGYNTALLCAGLGAEQVFSIDIGYTGAARDRLAGLGYRPVLSTGDGLDGMPDHAPFDRIIATVAVTQLPGAWLDQLAQDGVVLADVKIGATAGNLVLLRKRGHVAEGRFDSGQAWFMPMRHPGRSAARATTSTTAVERSTTALPAIVWDQPVPWFLACLTIPARVEAGYRLDAEHRPAAARLTADDGSWAEVGLTAGPRRTVVQAGSTRLWDAVEAGFETWRAHDRPGWSRLGMTVTAGAQRIWLDQPDGPTMGHLSGR